jgi:transcriptional regulator with XRE-family HTH domain
MTNDHAEIEKATQQDDPAQLEVAMQYPNRIRECRLAKGMSMKRLSRLTGIYPKRLRELEEGRHRFWPSYVGKIAVVLAVDKHELFREESSNDSV